MIPPHILERDETNHLKARVSARHKRYGLSDSLKGPFTFSL
jgi:hypothetical protein